MKVAGFRNQSEMPRLMASGDILVLPSAVEPWGLVVNEGLACGLVPVVSDAVGCGPDLVDGTGVTYATAVVDDLALAMERAFAMVGSTAFRVARGRYLREHSMGASAQGYERAVMALCAPLAQPSTGPSSRV